jgi:hypothetical protein
MTQRHHKPNVSLIARILGFGRLVEDAENLKTQNEAMRKQLESSRREAATCHRRNQELEDRAIELSCRSTAEWIQPERRMPKEEVRRAFSVPKDMPLWRAIHQELDDSATDLVDLTAAAPIEQASELKRLHAAGGLDALRNFQRRLIELQHLAEVEDPDLEGKDAA